MLADLFSPQNQQLNQKYPAQALDKIFHRAHWAVLRSRSFSPVPELWVPVLRALCEGRESAMPAQPDFRSPPRECHFRNSRPQANLPAFTQGCNRSSAPKRDNPGKAFCFVLLPARTTAGTKARNTV
jgi:hypothetical protein